MLRGGAGRRRVIHEHWVTLVDVLQDAATRNCLYEFDEMNLRDYQHEDLRTLFAQIYSLKRINPIR